MKTGVAFLLFTTIILSCRAEVKDKIKLNAPNLNRETTLMEALSQRQSIREYSSQMLSMEDLSDLLWAANGINRPDGKRTAASALNRQDIDIYVIMKEGAYLYDPAQSELNLIATGDYRNAVAGRQDFVKSAPVCLVLVSDLSKFGGASNASSAVTGALDAGIVSQNISLFCTSAGLTTVPRATMDSDTLKKILKLKPDQRPMLNHPVGYKK